MPLAARVGLDIVGAGGVILGPGAPTVLVNMLPQSTIFDAVAPHVPCPVIPIHCAATLVSGSLTVISQGLPATRLGDLASCGDSIVTGSINVIKG